MSHDHKCEPPAPPQPTHHINEHRVTGGAVFDFNIHLHHHSDPRLPDILSGVLTPLLTSLGETIVSALSDKIAEVKASLDAAIVRVQDDVLALQAKIDELQAKVDAGLATPEDIAALDELKASLDTLDPTKPDVIPTP